MLIPKLDPKFILIIQINRPIISFDLAILTNISCIVNNILVVIIVYHWRHKIEAAIDNEYGGTWFTRSHFSGSFIKGL